MAASHHDQFEQALAERQFPDDALALIRRAYDFSMVAHEGRTRLSGEPYVEHPIRVATTLATMGVDAVTVAAALLHDVPEDTPYTLVEVQQEFGRDIARLIMNVTKLGHLKYRGVERYAENLRRMFLAMAEDVRVILIKLADRQDNLTSLDVLPPEKRLRIARESLEIFAPVANRLGIGTLKGNIEDLAFQYVYPDEYRWVKSLTEPRYAGHEAYLARVRQGLEVDLRREGVRAHAIEARAKHLYSLYRKLLRPDIEREIGRIHDLIAIRLVVPSVADCYTALGLIHQRWKPVKEKIRDYIAQPKPNGYRSLHTTVFCLDGQIVEFQMRTLNMHREAEFGIAAHWHYTESGKPRAGNALPDHLSWVKELAEKLDRATGTEASLTEIDQLKLDVFRNRIFVFTPKGDVLDLPEESTPVDFAYTIHTDIGNHCTGARVNGKLVSLDVKLQSGDIVEILTDKNRRAPSADWLDSVRTQNARQHIRHALAAITRERKNQ